MIFVLSQFMEERFSRAGQSAHHGANRDIQGRGDRFVWKLIASSQQQHRPFLRVQAIHGLFDPSGLFLSISNRR